MDGIRPIMGIGDVYSGAAATRAKYDEADLSNFQHLKQTS